ncbi:hypothetical protein [Lentzea sp. NBRC 102530]|uniref:hypothetical protein n=1 Tax=Lentzea sp. NBRC 102530 TaxID=3032201 RepID=UPI002554F9AF|nr:hypothetical protein [Lentzea sp. NBRC 102530]
MTKLPAEGRLDPPPRFPLKTDLVLRARLTIARERKAELEDDAEAGRKVSPDKLDAARERVLVLEEIIAGQDEAEAELWAELWGTPQAVEWHRQKWTREVAMYVRWSVRAGGGDLDAAKEARQHADRLGLTPLALLRLRWQIVRDEVADQRTQRTQPAAAPPAPTRPRLKAVDDAG